MQQAFKLDDSYASAPDPSDICRRSQHPGVLYRVGDTVQLLEGPGDAGVVVDWWPVKQALRVSNYPIQVQLGMSQSVQQSEQAAAAMSGLTVTNVSCARKPGQCVCAAAAHMYEPKCSITLHQTIPARVGYSRLFKRVTGMRLEYCVRIMAAACPAC